MGNGCTEATSAVQWSACVAAADYASAVLASRLEVVFAIVVLSFAILVIGLVMLKGNLRQEHGLSGLGPGHPWDSVDRRPERNDNHERRSRHGLGLGRGLQTG
jgi:hypothetical protein